MPQRALRWLLPVTGMLLLVACQPSVPTPTPALPTLVVLNTAAPDTTAAEADASPTVRATATEVALAAETDATEAVPTGDATAIATEVTTEAVETDVTEAVPTDDAGALETDTMEAASTDAANALETDAAEAVPTDDATAVETDVTDATTEAVETDAAEVVPTDEANVLETDATDVTTEAAPAEATDEAEVTPAAAPTNTPRPTASPTVSVTVPPRAPLSPFVAAIPRALARNLVIGFLTGDFTPNDPLGTSLVQALGNYARNGDFTPNGTLICPGFPNCEADPLATPEPLLPGEASGPTTPFTYTAVAGGSVSFQVPTGWTPNTVTGALTNADGGTIAVNIAPLGAGETFDARVDTIIGPDVDGISLQTVTGKTVWLVRSFRGAFVLVPINDQFFATASLTIIGGDVQRQVEDLLLVADTTVYTP